VQLKRATTILVLRMLHQVDRLSCRKRTCWWVLVSWIWQHKLCATLPANININYRLSHQTILPYLYYYIYQNWNNSWKPYSVVSFNMGHYILYKGLFYPIMLKCLHYTTFSSCLSCTSCKLSHIMNNSNAIIM
jgi:hypothetical protein